MRPDAPTRPFGDPRGRRTTRAGAAAGPRVQRWRGGELLQLDGAAGLLDLALELLGLVALDAFLDRPRRLVDERLGLLEAEAGRRADAFDPLIFFAAGGGEHDAPRARPLRAPRAAAGRGAGPRRGGRGDGCRRHAELLLERLDAL